MSAQLLLILLVAFLVFGPSKLPMLSRHLGLLWRFYNQGKEQIHHLWQDKLQQQLFQDNLQKASQADRLYEKLKITSTEGQGHE